MNPKHKHCVAVNELKS